MHSLSFSIQWQISGFQRMANLFWDDILNQRLLFDELSIQLFDSPQFVSWYDLSPYQLEKEGIGANILYGTYNGSLYRALETIYPEYDWQFWSFKHLPATAWKDKDNLRDLFDHVSNRFKYLSYLY